MCFLKGDSELTRKLNHSVSVFFFVCLQQPGGYCFQFVSVFIVVGRRPRYRFEERDVPRASSCLAGPDANIARLPGAFRTRAKKADFQRNISGAAQNSRREAGRFLFCFQESAGGCARMRSGTAVRWKLRYARSPCEFVYNDAYTRPVSTPGSWEVTFPTNNPPGE